MEKVEERRVCFKVLIKNTFPDSSWLNPGKGVLVWISQGSLKSPKPTKQNDFFIGPELEGTHKHHSDSPKNLRAAFLINLKPQRQPEKNQKFGNSRSFPDECFIYRLDWACCTRQSPVIHSHGSCGKHSCPTLQHYNPTIPLCFHHRHLPGAWSELAHQ